MQNHQGQQPSQTPPAIQTEQSELNDNVQQQLSENNNMPTKKSSARLIVILSVTLIALIIFGITIFFFFIKSKSEPSAQPIENESQEEVIDKDVQEESEEKAQLITRETENTTSTKATVANPHGFEFSYPKDKIKHYYEERSGAFLFCEAGSPDDIVDVYGNQVKFGCIEINSLTNSKSLEEFSDMVLDAPIGDGYTLKSKEKINLENKQSYRAIYWKGDNAGIYRYIVLYDINKEGKNGFIDAIYRYDDYSIRNNVIIPIYEEVLNSVAVSQ